MLEKELKEKACEFIASQYGFDSPEDLIKMTNIFLDGINFIKSKDVRNYNVGNSDYSKHKIQPWDIWLEYGLDPWDADIIKRVLRKKEGDSRQMDYEKIIHICKEKIRQLNINKDG